MTSDQYLYPKMANIRVKEDINEDCSMSIKTSDLKLKFLRKMAFGRA